MTDKTNDTEKKPVPIFNKGFSLNWEEAMNAYRGNLESHRSGSDGVFAEYHDLVCDAITEAKVSSQGSKSTYQLHIHLSGTWRYNTETQQDEEDPLEAGLRSSMVRGITEAVSKNICQNHLQLTSVIVHQYRVAHMAGALNVTVDEEQ